MKKSILFIVMIISSYTSFGQTCGTPIPTKTKMYAEQVSARSRNVTYCIDVFFHVVRNSNGTNAFTPPNLNAIIDDLNEFYNVHNVFLRNAGSGFINNTSFVNIDNDAEAYNLGQTNNRSNAINYYIVETLWDTPQGFVTGTANSIPSNNLVIRNDRTLTSTSSHELGHCLNLYHTFQGTAPGTSGCAEAINGSNCFSCGDIVCDTPADQNNGVSGGYIPDLTNIMSYYRPRDHFTNGQGQRIRTAISQEPLLQNTVSTVCSIPRLSSINTLCTSGTKTLTISNLGGNTTTWEVSSNVTIVSSNNSSITIKARNSSSSGSAFVRARFSTTTYSPIERFWIGKPKLTGYISGNNTTNCSSIYIYEYNGGISGASSTRWEVGLQFDDISSVNGRKLFVDPTNAGDGYVTFVASNECGEAILCEPVSVSGWNCGPGYINFPTQYSCGNGGDFPFGLNNNTSEQFVVYPNPSSNGQINFKKTSAIIPSSAKRNTPVIVEMYRIDNSLKIRTESFKTEQFSVDVSGMIPGAYFFVIYQGASKEVKTIIIE